MKIGIMQPYLFPYIGYFQLINAVDKFIIHDDVQYIKGGWINRNRIQINEKDYLFTFSIKKDSFSLPINQRMFASNFPEIKEKFLSLLFQAYHKAPYFSSVQSLVNNILSFSDHNVSSFITNSLQKICSYMNITTPFILSSQIKKNNLLKGQERVININLVMRSTHYINLMGGINLYTKEKFDARGIKLNFIKMRNFEYQQFSKKFVPNLSILDALMFNDSKSIKAMLLAYDLV